MTKAGIPGPPLSHRWSLGTHMTQPLQLGVYPTTEASYTRFHTLCQPFGRTDQMRQAALPEPFPVLIDPIAITHEDTCPVTNELRKRAFRTMRMHLKVGHCWVRHHPQPVPITVHQPRGFINVVDQGSARDLANSPVMGPDRLRNPIHHLLNRPLTQRNAQH